MLNVDFELIENVFRRFLEIRLGSEARLVPKFDESERARRSFLLVVARFFDQGRLEFRNKVVFEKFAEAQIVRRIART